jgi:signal peptidase I
LGEREGQSEQPAGHEQPTEHGTVSSGIELDKNNAEVHPRKKTFLRELPVLIVVAVVVSALIKTFLMQAFFIPSQSMESTLLIDDRVMVSKLTTRFGEVKRGDIVVFRDPGGWLGEAVQPSQNGLLGGVRRGLAAIGLAPSGSERDLIKRVIGIPGDHVVCCDAKGRLTVNGISLDEPYVFAGDAPSELSFTADVPPNAYWVMGDHRGDSQDSRFHRDDPRRGMVPEDAIVGRAVVRVWPLGRIGLLRRPATFDQSGLNPK